MIYFIQCGDAVKIGKSNNVRNRLSQLESGNHQELKIIFTAEGDLSEERYLHSLFRDHRIKGEWFRFDEVIKKYIVDHFLTGITESECKNISISGQLVSVSVKLSDELLDAVHQMMEKEFLVNRSDAVRILVNRALESEGL